MFDFILIITKFSDAIRKLKDLFSVLWAIVQLFETLPCIILHTVKNMEENGPPKTADRTNRNIQDLPEELRIRIFSILPLKDIVSVCLVCKKWNSLANSESLWKIKCNSLPANVERERLNDDEKGCRWKV